MTPPPTNAGFDYRAFISYSHQDRAWRDWLHKALETYRVPSRLVGTNTAAGVIPRRLVPIFRDRDELPSATDLNLKVEQALGRSAALIVVCSPHAAQSRWVNEEVLAFKRMGRRDRILCLIVDGEPNASDIPGREAEECFCEALRFTVDTDGQPTDEHTEPIAADARPDKDGKANAKLKLIAGMLDVGFDALKQRELHRRNRRMVAITTAALVVMAITTTLAITAVVARHHAEVARQDALRRQKQAEGLVGFMLGDLNDKLGAVNRLDILQSVDDKAMAYFESIPSRDVTDDALALRANALQKIGAVRMNQNQLPEALKSFQAAAAINSELLERTPGDVSREAAYAASLNWIGQTYYYQGDFDHALQTFENDRDTLQRAVAQKPDDTGFAYSLETAHNNVGQVLDARGDVVAAKKEYDAALEIAQSLVEREPKNTDWKTELSWAWNNLGKIALQQGRLDQAIAAYRKDVQIKSALVAGDPANRDAQDDLVASNAILGRTLALCGEMESALQYVRAAVTSAKSLTAFDQSNASFKEDFARYSQLLGGLLRQQGQLDRAVAPVADALRVLNALVEKDPTNSHQQQMLAQAQLESAQLYLAMGNTGTARKSADAALALTRSAMAKKTGDNNWALLDAQTKIVRGEISAARHDDAAARADWMEARDTIAPLARSGDDPRFLAAWVSPMLLLGDIDTARPLLAKIAATGYRAPDLVALVANKKLSYPQNQEVTLRIADAMK